MAWFDRETAAGRDAAANDIEDMFDEAFNESNTGAVLMMGWGVARAKDTVSGYPELGWLDPGHADIRAGASESGRRSSVKIRDIAAGLVVELRLPRLVKDSVTIVVRDNILTISGEQSLANASESHPDWEGNRSRRFTRSISLPRIDGRHRIHADFRGDVVRILIRRPAA